MKSATLPPLRVEPALRKAALSVLRDGETLSAFFEEAVRSSIESRTLQREFIARGLAGEAEANREGSWVAAEVALAHFKARGRARRKASPRPRRRK